MKRVVLVPWVLLAACGGAADTPSSPSATERPAEPSAELPPPDPAVAPPRLLALGQAFVCVVRDARVLCAGEAPGLRSLGALAPLPWVDDVVEIDADDHTLCARRSDGTVRCAFAAEPPFDVAGVSDAVRIRVDMHLLVQREGGLLLDVSVFDEHGIRPLPAASPSGLEPTRLDASADVIASFGRACALGAHGSVACASASEPDVHPYVERGAQAIAIDNGDLLVLGADGTVGADMLNDERYELAPRDALGGLHALRGPCGIRDGAAVCPSFDTRRWRALPEARVEGHPFVEVARGFEAACAIDTERNLYCWGAPPGGIVETPGHVARGPSEVTGLEDATAVSVALDHACALRVGGGVSCWGQTFGPRPRPIELEVLGPVVELASTTLATCARSANGRVACWGRVDSMPLPPSVVAIADVAQLTAAGGTMCARLGVGAVTCWAPALESEPTPVDALAGASTIGGGDGFVCGVVGVTLRCHSLRSAFDGGGSPPVPTTLTGAVDEVAVGAESACWRVGETWRCIGHNGVGQLGTAPSRPLEIPTEFPAGVRALWLAHHRTCGIGASGVVRCAGVTTDGSPRTEMDGRGGGGLTTIGDIVGARSVALGPHLGCAVLDAGQVRCWGDGYEGGLGDGTSAILDEPRAIPRAE